MLLLVAFVSQAQVYRPATETTINRHQVGVPTGDSTSRNFSMGGQPQQDTSSSQQKIEGIDYTHHDIADTILQKEVFLFRHQPLDVGIANVEYPTLDPTGYEFVDPLDRVAAPFYLSRGCLGHQHYSITAPQSAPLAFNFRPQLFPALVKTPGNIAFYQTQRPYTLLHYGSSLNKDYRLAITHSQNITPRWNVALNYNLVSLDGVYTNSNVDNHQLDISTNYYSADSRYQLRAALIRQQFTTSENGGIAYDEQLTERRQPNRAGMVMNLYNAASRERDLQLFVHQSYNFVRQVPMPRHRDTVVFKQDTVTLELKPDTIVLTDTIWPEPPRAVTAGVVGLDLQYERLRRNYNDGSLDTSKLYYRLCRFSRMQTFDSSEQHTLKATLYWTNKAYPDYRFVPPVILTVGVEPQMTKISQDASSSLFASAAPFAKAVLTLPSHATLSALALTTLSDSYLGGNTKLQADLGMPFTVAGRKLRADVAALHTLAAPDYIYCHYDGNNYAWDNDLRKVSSSSVRLLLSDSLLGNVGFEASRIANSVAFNSMMQVQQYASSAGYLKADATLRLQRGWFHLDMHHLVQYSSNAVILPVPLYATKNSLYADLHLFRRALRAQTGVDLRYHTRFYADGYNPVVGAFYHQSEVEIGNYLWVDAFVSIQVKRATIFLKALHVNAPIDFNPHYFLLPHCPGQDLAVYWGLEWKFFD